MEFFVLYLSSIEADPQLSPLSGLLDDDLGVRFRQVSGAMNHQRPPFNEERGTIYDSYPLISIKKREKFSRDVETMYTYHKSCIWLSIQEW